MISVAPHSSIADLISAGLIKPPTRVTGEFKGRVLEAIIHPDGSFLYSGVHYSSPSVAAGRAVTIETRTTTPGRSYHSINGWKFWHISVTKDTKISLFELRQRAIVD